MNAELDNATPQQVKDVQEAGLRAQIAHVAAHSPFYKSLFKKHGIDPSSIRSLEDLHRIPCTDKDQLRDHNMDFLCVPREKVADFVATSGTTGEPVVIALSDGDLDRLAQNESLSFACAGVQPGDVIQLMATMDRRFMAGLAYFLGARKLGAGIIRTGAGSPQLQWSSIERLRPDHLVAVPSFLLKMLQYAEENGIDPKSTSVRSIICIGEPVRDQQLAPNALARRIQDAWPVALHGTYASTEMATAFTECDQFHGGHHRPELIITEILDEKGAPVKPGEAGELVVTPLGVEAMPLIRFRTGDIVEAHYEACACGRTTMRLGPVLGRKQHMVKYKGTTLYPPVLNDLLASFSEVEASVVIIDRDDLGHDEVVVNILCLHRNDALVDKLKEHIRSMLRVVPRLEFVDAEAMAVLQGEGRKKATVLDRRG